MAVLQPLADSAALDKANQDMAQQVKDAHDNSSTLRVRGGDSKHFYGLPVNADAELDVRPLQGILQYDPSELVIKVAAGTPLLDVIDTLAAHQQMLGFEPPTFAGQATIGGAVASDLCGAGRASRGAVRDYILGATVINGFGELLRFGGQVIKNVAGFDVSRLLAGSLGTLGVIVDVSLRVVPIPASEIYLLRDDMDANAACDWFAELASQPWPLSAASWQDGQARIRLSGSHSGIASAEQAFGLPRCAEGASYWHALNEYQLPIFNTTSNVWRINCAATSNVMSNQRLLNWGGCQRWMISDEEPANVFYANTAAVACLFFNRSAENMVFAPLDEVSKALQRRLKEAFDPRGVLNPGRIYEGE